MSEEIYIDEVNVSECCFYNNGKCNNPNGMACNCINNAVCYFKEIKRLQAKNEQLKALCDTYFTCYRARHNDIEGNLFSYRKALEEIREMCKTVEFPLMSKMINIIDEVLK